MWEVGQEVKIRSQRSQYRHIIAEAKPSRWNPDRCSVRLCCMGDFYASDVLEVVTEADSDMPLCPRCVKYAQLIGVSPCQPSTKVNIVLSA